ncbi:hypothetical protein, partial [Arthrobacter sp. H14]|uniref:hypothetical protein n=1 Tax=Arthrobacter sp. H14 TaxID=1312959 RepID=UPI00047AD59F
WSVPFGAGVAMTVDELPIMTGRNNPYWGEERYALMLYVTGTVAVSGLLAVFLRRGRHIRRGGHSAMAFIQDSGTNGDESISRRHSSGGAPQGTPTWLSDDQIMLRLHGTRSEEVLLWTHSRGDSVARLPNPLDGEEEAEVRRELELFRLLAVKTSLDRQWELTEAGTRIAGKIAVAVDDERGHRHRRLRITVDRRIQKTKQPRPGFFGRRRR